MLPMAKFSLIPCSLCAILLAVYCAGRGPNRAHAQNGAVGEKAKNDAREEQGGSSVADKREEQPTSAPLTDAQAQAIALKAHAEAAAMDRLPRFFYEAQSGNGDVDTMRDREECSISGLKEALDGPVADQDWLQWGVALAWTESHVLWRTGEREGRNFGAADVWRNVRVWTKELAFSRGESADIPARFGYALTPDYLWEGSLRELAYFRVTPHRFWWATSSTHNDNISLVPPEKADYRFVAGEPFDDEPCDVVESRSRAERLWIGRKSGRLRGVLTFRFRGGGPQEPFHQNARVQEIAGRSFASEQEFGVWQSGDAISLEQKVEILRVWCELHFDAFGPNELIRFRDYREIAPGVWIPFREDRAFTHATGANRERRKYIRLWVAVQEAGTKVDLTDRIESLRPRDGQQIADQRFGVAINYFYKRDRTQSELLKLVDAERRKQPADAWRVNRMTVPIEALVGKPAPELPAEGWVGGPRPPLADRPYLIHFWSDWSEPSKNEMALLRQLADQGLTIVGMHPAGPSSEELGKLINDWQLRYPTYLAPAKSDGEDQKIAGYPVAKIPYCILVDRDGRVAGHGPLGRELVVKLREAVKSED